MPQYSNYLELAYANEYGNFEADKAAENEYGQTMEEFYARQYGNYAMVQQSENNLTVNAEPIKYINSLELLYTSQYGNVQYSNVMAATDGTITESAPASGIEYTNSLELFYASQYGNQISVLVVDASQ